MPAHPEVTVVSGGNAPPLTQAWCRQTLDSLYLSDTPQCLSSLLPMKGWHCCSLTQLLKHTMIEGA